MLEVIKTIILLLFELLIFYILGTAVEKIVIRERKQGISEKIIVGFLILQILFQICALPFIYFDTTLTLLSRVWSVGIGIIVLCSAIANQKKVREDITELMVYFKTNKWAFLSMLVVIVLVCYYVSINGEQNDDAVYYIGLINTTVSMDSMYRFNVYNGFGMESLYLRRALTTFDIHSATLCKLFDIHPLVLTRIGRASLNVILTATAMYLLGKRFFVKNEGPVAEKKACMLVEIAFLMNFLFAGNIYTSATFLLTRAYEGKAFSANVLILYTLFICIGNVFKMHRSDYVILLLILWGSLAISSSAIVVNLLAVVVCLLPCYVIQRIDRIRVKKNGKC